ncbi:hypothetical protein SPHINGO8BC_51387 [Sphingobacterium multivorum]|uniref:Uncharacterized protein n=1 Tax=Sphingobacterium multivorum TaxID=28454 RepID=A0A654D1C6_SPHMU|nr:hypothetical protein SPHINGO8BC_51387 [Sphingobacterium multivorum]
MQKNIVNQIIGGQLSTVRFFDGKYENKQCRRSLTFLFLRT